MYFKANFISKIDESNSLFESVDISNITGKESLLYNNYEFEIERNSEKEIESITFCNQCVNTYGIERELINLILELIDDEDSVKLFDSNGLIEEFTKEELEEYLS